MNQEHMTATRQKYRSKNTLMYTEKHMFDSMVEYYITPPPRKVLNVKVGMVIDNDRVEEVYPFTVRLKSGRYLTLGELVQKHLEPEIA